MKSLLRALGCLLLLGGGLSVGYGAGAGASEDDLVADRALESSRWKQLATQIERFAPDPGARDALREEARERTALCRHCHGEDGVAIRPLVPNLAGQNPVYLLDQLHRFASGQRYDYLMSELARLLSEEEKTKLAIYYSEMAPGTAGGGTPDQIEEGRQLYASICHKCHGDGGRGQKGYARLAGQRSDYVVKMLKEFKQRTGRRRNVWMTGVAVRLSEQQMTAVAAYLANLR